VVFYRPPPGERPTYNRGADAIRSDEDGTASTPSPSGRHTGG
jgi:hypothetical protein